MFLKECIIKFFLLTLIAFQANAYMVENTKVTPDLLYIQVGAFSQKSSIDMIRKKLHNFPLWMEKKENMTKVYVVSNPKYKKAMFHKVKKLIPDAFIRHKTKEITLRKHSVTPQNNIPLSNNQINLTTPLDSKAILRTRKKFF